MSSAQDDAVMVGGTPMVSILHLKSASRSSETGDAGAEYAQLDEVHQATDEGNAEIDTLQADSTPIESNTFLQSVLQSSEAADAGVDCAHDEEVFQPDDEEAYQPNDEENVNVEIDAVDSVNSAFSADEQGVEDYDDCETCDNSQEMYRVYCQNCDLKDNKPDIVCSHCRLDRGRMPCGDCQNHTYYDRAKIDLSAAVVSYNPSQRGRYPQRDALLRSVIGDDNTFESVLRRVDDEDAVHGDRDPLFDDRSPLVLSIDEYYLFPGRTYGEGIWTITIGKDRAAPGGMIQFVRRLIFDLLAEVRYLLVNRPKELAWEVCRSSKEKAQAIWRPVQNKLKGIKGHYEYMREPIVEATHINVKDMKSLKLMLNNLEPLFTCDKEPTIGLDLEGVNLGRRGEACIMQIADYLTAQNYLVDLRYLGQRAFTTKSDGNDLTFQNVKDFFKQKLFRFHPEDEIDIITAQEVIDGLKDLIKGIFRPIPDERKITLKDVLESPRVKKLLWDVRMDSDALYAHFGIKLAGVWDLQLMRVYLNSFSRRPRLADSVRAEDVLQGEELMTWERSKRYYFPRGYEEWRERPISPILKAYAIGDVTPMEKMLQKLRPQLGDEGMAEVERMTDLLIEETWQRVYVSTRASSPWG